MNPRPMTPWRELVEMVRMAATAVKTNILRSSLTILGVFVGVFSIIAVMTGIRVLQQNLEDAMNGLGANTFQFQRFPAISFDDADWEKYLRRKRFRIADLSQLERRVTLAQAVSASANFGSGEASSRYAQTSPNIPGNGMTPEAFTTQNLTLGEGRGFSAADDDSGRLVCVLGFDLAAKLFPRGSPLSESVKFQGISYKVVGVLAQRGALFGQSRDNFIAIPLGTARRLYGENLSVQLQIQAPNRDTYAEMVEQARGVLRTMRQVPPGDDDDFEIVSNESAVSQFRSLTSAIRLGVAAISSIALIAAGIGIMNIMLVSVTERTREIGIRLAIGAHGRDVLMQFLIEATILSSLGGVIGILLGIGSSQLVSHLNGWPVLVSTASVVIAFVFSAAVGMFFGFYPARKAAQLDPIDALRYE